MPGREAHHLRPVGIADLAEGGIDAVDHLLEQAAAAIEAVDAHRDQQAVRQQLVAIGAMDVDQLGHASSSGSSRKAISRLPVVARIRSLLTISAAECASRKWRP